MTGLQRLQAFFRSPHHAWLALLTLGIGVAIANVPGMIVAVASYALGWIFLPDSKMFRQWSGKKAAAKEGAVAEESAADFLRQRSGVYSRLSGEGRKEYDILAAAVEEIRAGSGKDGGPHAGRLGQLAWTCLRLLLTRETLTAFCAQESSAAILGQIQSANAEIVETDRKVLQAETDGNAADAGGLERLSQSMKSRLETLEQRAEHIRKAEHDLALTHSEIERIYDAVRLIKADLVTRRDPDTLGAEIDRTAAHFHRTRDWLRDLEFDQTPSDISDEITAWAPLQVEE